jgi:hypothetical protein
MTLLTNHHGRHVYKFDEKRATTPRWVTRFTFINGF